MSQQAHGVGITQISVSASANVNIAVNGQLAVQLLAPMFPRPLHSENPQEIDLLKAAHAMVPFTGRADIFRDFVDWCSDTRAVSMRILVGQGGSGKTRFAYELYRHFRTQPGWAAYFLRFLKNEAKEVDLWTEIEAGNALIIADYASDYPQPLADLLRPLTDAPRPGRRIRMLLLARTADWDQGWLASLRSGRTGEEVDRSFHPLEPQELPALNAADRQTIFQQTVNVAAEFTGTPVPLLQLSEQFAKKDVAERLADPLTLMMGAVTALHSGSATALSLSRTDLALEVSKKLVADRMRLAVDDHQDLFLHMAAYITLCGGLEKDQALHVLDEESAQTGLGRVSDPAAFLDRLQSWLPVDRTDKGGDETNQTWVGTIQPDIVGEAFVLGKSKSVYLRGSNATILRAVRQRPVPTINTVIRTAQDFSFAATVPRQEPLLWLEKLIDQGEADVELSMLAQLSDAMPRSSVILRHAGLRISRVLCGRLRALSEAAQAGDSLGIHSLFASSLSNLANRQSDVGQREAALATAQESADLRRQLVLLESDTFAEGYARVQGTFANALNVLDRASEAALIFGDAIRSLLPAVQKYPKAHMGLFQSLVSNYLSTLEAAHVEPDGALVGEVFRLLKPYLNLEGDDS